MKGLDPVMKILVCNVGSTSLKYQLFDMEAGEKSLCWGKQERVGAQQGAYAFGDASGNSERIECQIPDYEAGIGRMLAHLTGCGAVEDLSEIACVGFKTVHAKGVTGVQLLNEEVLSQMADFNSIAPSHNPPYIAAIRQFQSLLPGVPLVASFETGFHAAMPPKAYLYSIPKAVSERYAIRRYGFHGASHEYVSGKVAEYMGEKDIRVISCHLGGSGSIAAVRNGVSVDTSFGLSLQSGLMHNNRCGDIDPYILIYLMEEQGYSLSDIKAMLGKESGLLGMSKVSNDLRDVEQAASEGNVDAQIALDAYCYGIQKYIGAYAAALGGVDAIAFAGGIGENSPTVREKSLQGLDFMGISLDAEKNRSCRCDAEISGASSRARIYVIATDEEIVVARKALAYLTAGAGK